MQKKPVERPLIIQPQDPSYRLISLTQGQVCKVDTADYEWLSQWNWYALRTKRGTFYACRSAYLSPGKVKIVHMHQILCGVDPGRDVMPDHHNRDTLDNRRHNLRPATNQKNTWNTGMRITNRSGYRGVSWKKYNRKWAAQINRDGKRVHLGLFESASDASLVYEEAAKRIYGDFYSPSTGMCR